MTAVELPIDPDECGLSFEPESAVHGRLRARVPAALVRRFRKKMRKAGREADLSEVKSELVRFLCSTVAARSGIRLVSAPLVRRGAKEPKLSTDKDFILDLDVDTAARLEYPETLDVELLEPDAPVTDELVEQEMERQRLHAGERRPVDRVELPCEVALALEIRVAEDERPLHSDPSYSGVLDESGALLALSTSFPGVGRALAGVGVGERKVVSSAFPADTPTRALRGQPALIAVTVRSAAAITPASVEQVLAQYGTSTETRLRTQIRFALEQQRTQSVHATLRDQMSRALETLFPIAVPGCRARMLAGRIEGEFRALSRARGWNDDRTDREWSSMRGQIERDCESAAKQRVILQSLPAGKDVDVGEEKINARIADLAARRGLRPEQMRSQLVESGRFDEFTAEVIAEAMLDALVRKARVRAVPVDEWRAAMEARGG